MRVDHMTGCNGPVSACVPDVNKARECAHFQARNSKPWSMGSSRAQATRSSCTAIGHSARHLGHEKCNAEASVDEVAQLSRSTSTPWGSPQFKHSTDVTICPHPPLASGLSVSVQGLLRVASGPPQHRKLCEHEQDDARPRQIPKSVVSIPSGCRPPLGRSHFIVHDAHHAAGARPRSASH
jgi:hypothetical protein